MNKNYLWLGLVIVIAIVIAFAVMRGGFSCSAHAATVPIVAVADDETMETETQVTASTMPSGEPTVVIKQNMPVPSEDQWGVTKVILGIIGGIVAVLAAIRLLLIPAVKPLIGELAELRNMVVEAFGRTKQVEETAKVAAEKADNLQREVSEVKGAQGEVRNRINRVADVQNQLLIAADPNRMTGTGSGTGTGTGSSNG